jgi:hypothetical protein
MKPRYKMALGMFLLVVVAGAASAGVFYFEGSQAAVYAQVAVVPLLILVGYLWVNRTIQATGTSRTEFERRKARQLGEQFSDIWQLAQRIESEYEDGITDAEWEELERHIGELESNGLSFDPSAGTFEISSRNLSSLEDINRMENEIDGLDDWLLTQFTENVRGRITAVNTSLERLSALVADPWTVDPGGVPEAGPDGDEATSSWRDTGDRLEDCYEAADQVIEEACGAIQDALTSTDDAADPQAEQLLSDARQAGTARQYDDAVADVLDARDMVERDAATTFDDQQEAIDALLRMAGRKPFDQYLGPAHHDAIEEHANELASFDDAIEIAELRRVREDARETCLEVVEELEGQLTEAVNTLDSADVPEGWYERPPAAETSFVRSLQATPDIETFHDEFDTAVDSLLSALESVKPKAGVVTGFDRMEAQITETLRAEGVVTGSDLPVSELEEQFLGLYYRKHMDEVEFDPDEPRLSTAHGGESYSVHVSVAFPEGGREREVTVTLSGSTTYTEVCRTPLVAETTFEDVPYGEYTVRAEPVEDSYSSVERTVTVDDDLTVDLELEELSLRDQLCEGVDIDVDEILATLSSRFETKFDEEGYLSTEMSFPVDDEYVPCLLTVWSQRQGYDATRYDGDIVVYDTDLLRKEIENVIRYNLEPGDSKTYDALRSNFLSAPVSDSTVEELVRNSSEQEVVTVESTQLTKEEDS